MLVLAMEFSRSAGRAGDPRLIRGQKGEAPGGEAGRTVSDGTRHRRGGHNAARCPERARAGSLPQNGIVMPARQPCDHGRMDGTSVDVRSIRGGTKDDSE